jgi:hypothetical protein
MSRIHILHENPAWLDPFARAFSRRGLPWSEWLIDGGVIDLGGEPPEGVFYSRISASAHTRDHRHAPDYTAALLAWLERHGRRVVNGLGALDLEISKVRQYAALERAGLRVPRTVAVVGKERVAEAARQAFGAGPVILKPNRGGKGLGVQLFQSIETLAEFLASPAYEAPVDGVHLLQEYVQAPEPVITRAEFVGGRFLYAVEVDTTGGFELCPADACAVGDAFCPAGAEPRPKFRIVDGIDPKLQHAYEGFLAANGIEIAGIEFIRGLDGEVRTYDVNTNTNYNPEAEARAGRSGPDAVAEFLGRELARLREQPRLRLDAAA